MPTCIRCNLFPDLAVVPNEGYEEGVQIGRDEGVQIGQIRILEQLINDHPTADESLASLTLSELHERLSLLKDRYKRRGNS